MSGAGTGGLPAGQARTERGHRNTRNKGKEEIEEVRNSHVEGVKSPSLQRECEKDDFSRVSDALRHCSANPSPCDPGYSIPSLCFLPSHSHSRTPSLFLTHTKLIRCQPPSNEEVEGEREHPGGQLRHCKVTRHRKDQEYPIGTSVTVVIS